jgi:hypothetical protein
VDATLPVLLTPHDVGLWLTLPTNEVLRLARRGQIPSITLPNGEVMFEPARLARWVAGLPAGAPGGEGAADE